MLENSFKVIISCINNLSETLIGVQRTFLTFSNSLNIVLSGYPNKRIIYLALHHKKARVRKKNINRIMRWIRKEGNNGDTK